MPILQERARQAVRVRAYQMALPEEPTPQKEENIHEENLPRLRQKHTSKVVLTTSPFAFEEEEIEGVSSSGSTQWSVQLGLSKKFCQEASQEAFGGLSGSTKEAAETCAPCDMCCWSEYKSYCIF